MSQEPNQRRVVYVVIVSYKTARFVSEALRTLHAERTAQADHLDIRCCVVDNCAEDAPVLNTLVTREHWEDWVDVLTAERNGGFAYGNNIGFRRAYETGLDPAYFFLLNPDTLVRPGAIRTLTDFLDEHPDAGSAGSGLEGDDDRLWPYAFRFPNLIDQAVRPLGVRLLERLFQHHMVTRALDERPSKVDWYPGAAMMCRAQVITELGGMDEAYFLYFEETDFCLKVQRAGWSHWFVPESRVKHFTGQSTGVTGEHNSERRLPSYWYDSRRRYFIKNHGLPYAMATDALALAGQTLGRLQRKVRGKGKKEAPLVASIVDFYRGSTLRRENREIAPAAEYRPSAS